MGRKKTERVYTPLESMSHFAKKIASFGNSVAYRYFDKDRNLLSITYQELSLRMQTAAAGFASIGLAGKRIAIIGETSVDWICAYVASVASGGVAIPLDKELDVNELSKDVAGFGHGGGDYFMIKDIIAESNGEQTQGLTSIDNSVQSHIVGFAAERSRLAEGELQRIRMD